jgi:hypothetical protein
VPRSELTAAASSHLCCSRAARAEAASNPISHTRRIASSWADIKADGADDVDADADTGGGAYVAVQYFAVRSNSAKSSKYNLATTASWGSFGSGQLNSACKDNKALLIVNAGLHLSFKMSCGAPPIQFVCCC